MTAPVSVTTAGVVTFDPAVATTPRLTSVSPTTAFQGTVLTIVGSGLGATAGTVSVGGAACAVTSWTASNVQCQLGACAAGALSPCCAVCG
jgi:hypothetical protein